MADYLVTITPDKSENVDIISPFFRFRVCQPHRHASRINTSATSSVSGNQTPEENHYHWANYTNIENDLIEARFYFSWPFVKKFVALYNTIYQLGETLQELCVGTKFLPLMKIGRIILFVDIFAHLINFAKI